MEYTLEELREKQNALKNRKSLVDGSGDKQAVSEYTKKVFAEQPSDTTKVFADLVRRFDLEEEQEDTISYEEGRKLLWSLIKTFVISYPAKFEDGVFIVDDRNKKLIQALLNYFLGIEDSLSLKKGLFLTGSTGVGKTLILEIFQQFAKCNGVLHSFKKYSAADIYNDYKETGNAYLNFLSKQNILIDDLGAEPPVFKEYGNDVKPLLDLLELRHRQSLINPKLRTFITSNLSADEIGERYGQRVKDRFKNFNIINLTGDSRR